MSKHLPGIMITIAILLGLLTGCECGHDSINNEQLMVHSEEVCTLVKVETQKYSTYYYYYIPSLKTTAPQMVENGIYVKDTLPVKPTCGKKYLVNYSYWRCKGCNEKGVYNVKDVYVVGEANE